VYRYNAAGQLTEVVHGDGRSEFQYNEATGMPSTVSHTERELEYRWDFEYAAGLLAEERIDYVAKTGLSNAKFSYEYDSQLRVVALQGRIGGQSLPSQAFAYDQRTGRECGTRRSRRARADSAPRPRRAGILEIYGIWVQIKEIYSTC